uniref:Glutathione S-transferase omega n=1 Tax=Phallusia mammillata TaxID=59560 RepID=A0A6F9DDK1_9ASCI|nr:glutathione S-transferase omega-1-like [Phallusia mammillata]
MLVSSRFQVKIKEVIKMAAMGNERHLAAESTVPPPPKQDVLRVYSMKFCPYAQRLKLVLAAKAVKHETVNINLVKKPQWYLEKNPRGLVPTIEINGDIIYESDITSEYIDKVYPGRKIVTADPLKRAKELMLMGDHGKIVGGFYGAILAQDDEKRAAAFTKMSAGLDVLDKFLSNSPMPFVCGEQPGFTDYMMWPHLERIHIYLKLALANFKNVQAYIAKMEKDEAVQACRLPDELHKEFAEGYKTKNINYDIGDVVEYNF